MARRGEGLEGFGAFPGQGGPGPAAAVRGMREPEVDESIDLAKYLGSLRRRWPLLLICCIVFGSFAFIRYSLTEKEYRSTVTIQIERKRLSLLALGQAGWLEDWWNLEYYPTQYRLLRSRGMAERVVLNLRLHEDPSFNPRAASLTGGELEGLESGTELARLGDRVRQNLSVTPIKDTQLVELAYVSTSPELSARIANGYAEVFIEWGIENRTSTVGQASTFLNAQIDALRAELEEKQKQLNAFANASDYSLDPAGEALVERRATLEKQYNSAIAERISKEAAYREIVDLSEETVANTMSGGRVGELKSEIFGLESEYRSKLDTYTPEWPEMVALSDQIDEKRTQLAQLVRETYREAKDRAFAEFQKARREEQTLAAELGRLAADARNQNEEALEYANLATYIDTRRDLLSELVKRQSETEVASRVQTSRSESNVRIVDRAVVPSGPFRPSLQGDLSKALVLGLMLGVGFVFVLEFFDRTVKTPEELEALFGLPVLAVIPDINERGGYGRRGARGYSYNYGYSYGHSEARGVQDPKRKADEPNIELLPHQAPRTAVSEAYRSLRTALMLSTADDLQVIALTSAEPGEGKTATTTNLAVVMAQLGRRVLIIDGDLRRPRMHKVFGVSNRHGLVTFLTSHVELGGLLHESQVPNLFVCTAGPIPPNPSELLASERMRELVQSVRKSFDIVLIDTPPTLPVADAVILGTLADGVVVCSRAGVLLREDAKLCRERLRYAEVRLIGTVLNRYRSTPGRYTKKYRYYGVYEEPRTNRSSAA
ncbi:MAG: polysaccharide biosynthesis tyrosine autokinase [Acidobacteriota bacterium]